MHEDDERAGRQMQDGKELLMVIKEINNVDILRYLILAFNPRIGFANLSFRAILRNTAYHSSLWKM